MDKAILISINPKWVAKILKGEKTLEIRKTMPKCDLPIDVYIYCTLKDLTNDEYIMKGLPISSRGKVVAKFTLNKIDKIHLRFEKYCAGELSQDGLLKYACLTEQELDNYLWSNRCIGYAWHIDNLEIFDRPKPLQPFFDLDRPPQSWCYIEV